jgi:hypothetical protein
MEMIRAQQDSPSLRSSTPRTPRDRPRCGVLIMGFRRAHIFAATELFISAHTLGDEEAILAWLAQHDIYGQGLREGNGLMTGWGADSQRST